MKLLKDFVRWFFYITTAVLIICAFHFGVSDSDLIPKKTLWQILLSGLLTAGVTTLLYPGECSSKNQIFPRCLLHYGALCAVMIVSGHWFGWLEYDFGGIVMMLLSVAVVYLICVGTYFLIDLHNADKINRRLQEKYGEKKSEIHSHDGCE